MSVEVEPIVSNLKITFGNDGQLSEGEIDDSDSELAATENLKDSSRPDMVVEREMLPPSEAFRVYENKGGAFYTGIDLGSEDIKKKLIDRAARFGIERSEKTVTQEEIDALYKSLEIDLDKGQTGNIRLDTLHVRGVDDMSTGEVISYFREYGPASVEWINDTSCNVIWLENIGAARAVLGLSRPFVVKRKEKETTDQSQTKEPVEEDKNIEETTDSKMEQEEVIYMSDTSSDDEDDDDKFIDYKHRKTDKPPNDDSVVDMDVDTPMEPTTEQKTSDCGDTSVDVPVPPGHWRLGVPHDKAKAILLRFATKDDKKIRGAERRSQYYQKYGNPNYGGLKGLISNTRKRKFNFKRQKDAIQTLSLKESSSKSDELSTPEVVSKSKSGKPLRMRMRADEEEEKIKKRNERKQRNFVSTIDRIDEGPKLNVHARLGRSRIPRGRWTPREDFEELQNDSNDDGEYEQTKKTGEKLTRFNVWTDLAHSMAHESRDLRDRRQESSHKAPSGDLRVKLQNLRRKNKIPRRSVMVRDSDTESDSDF